MKYWREIAIGFLTVLTIMYTYDYLDVSPPSISVVNMQFKDKVGSNGVASCCALELRFDDRKEKIIIANALSDIKSHQDDHSYGALKGWKESENKFMLYYDNPPPTMTSERELNHIAKILKNSENQLKRMFCGEY